MGRKNRTFQQERPKTDLPAPLAPSQIDTNGPRIDNSLAGAMGIGIGGGSNAWGVPGFPGSQQPLAQTAPIFGNLRWYFLTNDRNLLAQAYCEIGLFATVIDIPVDDALRGGVEIKSKQLDEDQIQEIQTALDRDDDLNTVGQQAKWNRLFGGAALLILTDQDPESPLDVNALTEEGRLEFRAVDMWELFWAQQNVDDDSHLELREHDFECYDYRGHKIHKSRVMMTKGKMAPSYIRPRLRGWGLSELEILVNSVNQYLKSNNLVYEVLDEFKLDIYKLKNLANTLMSPIGEQKVRQRMQVTNQLKNYQRAIVLDSEDDFDHKQLSFAGLAEAQIGIRLQVCADMRFAYTKLFGQSASTGLGNSDQNEMENYNSMVESTVRNKIKYDILRVIELRCQQKYGFIPDDLSITFKPLRVLSAVDEETVKTQKYTRLSGARQMGEITTMEFRDAANKGNLFDVTLDTSEDRLNPDDPEIEELVKEGSKAGAEEDAEGDESESDDKEVN